MSSLKRILVEIADQRYKMGGTLSDTVTTALEQHRRQLLFGFVCLDIVLIGIVVFSIYGIATHLDNPTQMAAFSGAMGITVGGAVELMRRIWREWGRTGLLLILAEDASESQIDTILNQLIKKL